MQASAHNYAALQNTSFALVEKNEMHVDFSDLKRIQLMYSLEEFVKFDKIDAKKPTESYKQYFFLYFSHSEFEVVEEFCVAFLFD